MFVCARDLNLMEKETQLEEENFDNTGCFVTSGADCTPKNNEKKSHKYMSHVVSSFMRYNEFYKQSKL